MESAYELFVKKGIEKTSVLEIVLKAGMAKGTFYLYYADKYAVRDELIAMRSSEILSDAMTALRLAPAGSACTFEDKIVFLANYIIDYLTVHQDLLHFIEKNLGSGLLSRLLYETPEQAGMDFRALYHKLVESSGIAFQDADILLFMIIELIGSSGNSPILYSIPMPIAQYKPHLFGAIRSIIHSQEVHPRENAVDATPREL